MIWISLILTIIQFAMKLPDILDAVRKLIEIIKGQPFWKRSGMAKEALAAVKAAVDRAPNIKGHTVHVSSVSAQHACAPELFSLCQKWEELYGKAK